MAWSLCWAGVSTVVVLFPLATLTSFPMLLPGFEKRGLSPRISQELDKTELQCALDVITCSVSSVIPHYRHTLCFSPANPHACLAEWCFRLTGWIGAGSGVSSFSLKWACIAFCFASASWANSACADHLQGAL